MGGGIEHEIERIDNSKPLARRLIQGKMKIIIWPEPNLPCIRKPRVEHHLDQSGLTRTRFAKDHAFRFLRNGRDKFVNLTFAVERNTG
jgi:hypothetical protein